jgi:hypothetical protein
MIRIRRMFIWPVTAMGAAFAVGCSQEPLFNAAESSDGTGFLHTIGQQGGACANVAGNWAWNATADQCPWASPGPVVLLVLSVTVHPSAVLAAGRGGSWLVCR